MNKVEGQIRIPSGCAISAVISKEGQRITGEKIIESMKPMHDRPNGLGGAFAAYGIYPEYKDFFALHMFLDDRAARKNCEAFLRETMEIVCAEQIPTRTTPAITDEPLIWRFFVTPLRSVLASMQVDEEECVARAVMAINTQMKGAYVFSSGKNMGVFKAVGFPEDVGYFYRLEEYEAYSWTSHGRYPTNTPGWWGGAHPFALLDYSIVHNGHLCRTCQTGKCNWGIATQDSELVKRLDIDTGSQRLISLMTAWKHEIKEMMGGMGINSIEALKGNRLMLRGIGMTDRELDILGISHAGE